jgi:hypothetical protein
MKNAQEIMGENFVGPKEIRSIYGINIINFPLVPFSQEQLVAVKNDHILIATSPLSIIGMKGIIGTKMFFWRKSAWYNNEVFAQDQGKVGWELIGKNPVKNSTDKTLTEQIKLLGENKVVPTAQAIVYLIASYYLMTGIFLFGQTSVRTSSRDSKDCSIEVGVIRGEWIGISRSNESKKGIFLGLAEAIKPNLSPL